jgi:dolichol-phosphate mannosyltransferase
MIILSLSNAALMVAVGILGEYVGRIFEEGKGRPLYIVSDTWNFEQPRKDVAAANQSRANDKALARPSTN